MSGRPGWRDSVLAGHGAKQFRQRLERQHAIPPRGTAHQIERDPVTFARVPIDRADQDILIEGEPHAQRS
jgi:hypothetical protein